MRGILALVIGAAFALGFFAGRWVPRDDVPPPGPGDPDTTRRAPDHAPAAASHREPTDGEAAREQAAEAASPAQLELARAEALRSWREVRSQPMPEEDMQQVLQSYAENLRTLAARQARYQAEQANKKEADAALLQSDDVLAMLHGVDRHNPDLTTIAHASSRFASFFAARIGGSTVDGRSLDPSQAVGEGTTVAFPGGVFALPDLGRGREPFPSDVTVRGAGMDRTLLVAAAQHPRGDLRRLAIEDCTVYADKALVDSRQATVLALRRVRVVGFDCGAGSSVAIYASGTAAVLAQDCRFEGGYGRSPSSGNLINTDGTLLARFESCLFDRMGLQYVRAASTVFANCTMTDLLGQLPSGPVYENCRVQPNELYRLGQWQQVEETLRRDLDTLFPQWQQQLR